MMSSFLVRIDNEESGFASTNHQSNIRFSTYYSILLSVLSPTSFQEDKRKYFGAAKGASAASQSLLEKLQPFKAEKGCLLLIDGFRGLGVAGTLLFLSLSLSLVQS